MNKPAGKLKDSRSNAAPLFSEITSVPEALALTFEAGGVELALGICSGLTTPFFEALYAKTNIRTIQVRQEILGALAGNAYGRLTAKPIVLSGEGEFILGTGTQGIIESLLGSTPMVILTEMFDGGKMSHHGAYHGGSGDLGGYDAVSAFKAICKKVFVSHSPEQLIQHAQLALKHATSGEPGPVAVIMHSASLEGVIGPDAFPRLYPTSGYVKEKSRAIDADAIATVAGVVAGAERPIIIAGHGVRLSQAYEQLHDLSHTIGAPVVTTQGGKGVFDEKDSHGGGVFAEWGRESANALVGEADVVIAVGTKLGPIDTLDQNPKLIDPARQTLIQIDISDVNAAWTFPIDHVLIGDAGVVMEALARACDGQAARRSLSAPDRVRRAIDSFDLPEPEALRSEEWPMRPERLARIIEQEWPEDGIIASDAGESRVHMLKWFNSRGGGRYVVPHGGGGMGYAIPGAFGAKMACPDKACLGVLGDGGFGMTMNVIMNGVQEGVGFGVVIFNNGALGWPLHVMRPENQKHFEFYDFDHAAIARAMGADGMKCRSIDDVRTALRAAAVSKVPYVIDVPITIAATFAHSTNKLTFEPRKKPFGAKAE